MEAATPSRTALLSAMSRARHQILDGGRIFPDPLALRILGKEAAHEVTTSPETRVSRALRGPLIARSRIAEDAVRSAVALGTRQYVMLGAGLDTFAYRNPFPGDALRVFEIDHPATQRWKLGLLKDGDIPVPTSVAFVPVDFEKDDFMEKLCLAGFDPTLPTIYSWLGVTVYLSEESVMTTLNTIRRSSAAGSVVVFDYVGKPERWNLLRRATLAVLSKRFARMGEPWRSFFDQGELEEALLAMGYRRLESARPEGIAEALFAANDVELKHRRAGRNFGGVMKAWV